MKELGSICQHTCTLGQVGTNPRISSSWTCLENCVLMIRALFYQSCDYISYALWTIVNTFVQPCWNWKLDPHRWLWKYSLTLTIASVSQLVFFFRFWNTATLCSLLEFITLFVNLCSGLESVTRIFNYLIQIRLKLTCILVSTTVSQFGESLS